MCSDAADGPTAIREGSLVSSVALTEYDQALIAEGHITEGTVRTANQLARAVAISLADGQSRRLVKDEMRASPFVENKIVLQSLLNDNHSLRALLAQQINLSETLSKLPELDFYLPFDLHRYNWKSTPDLLVGIVLNVDSPVFYAYDTSGKQHTIDAREGLPPKNVLLLHPAEKKSLHGRPLTPGDVVEDTPTLDRSPLSPAQECEPPFCGGGGGGSPSGAILDRFLVYYGDGVGDTEPEFTFKYYVFGQVAYSKFLPYGNKEEQTWHVVRDYIWPVFYNEGDVVEVHLIENDQFLDDEWGFGTIETLSDPFRITTYTSCSEIGDPPPPCTYEPAIIKGQILYGHTETSWVDYVPDE